MAIAELGVSIIEPLLSIWYGIVKTVPGVIAALVILVFGYLVSLVVHYLVENGLNKAKVDKWVLEKTNLMKVIGAFRLSNFMALLAKWYTFILFMPPAANQIALDPLANFLMIVALWVPNVIVAVLEALVGVMAAQYLEQKIVDTKAKSAAVIGSAAKFVIYIFTVLIVLEQIGVKIAVAQNSFLIILGGIMLAIALMAGIGFGIAFKEEAKKIIHDVKRKL